MENQMSEEESINQAAAAEMASAMSGVTNQTPINTEPEIPELNDDVQSQDDTPAEPTIEDKIRSILEENQKLKKAIDTTNGRYGSELQALRSRFDTLNKSSDLSAAIANLNIDNPSFANLRENYPELGKSILDGIKEALASNLEATKQDPNQDQGKDPINERIEQIAKDQEEMALDAALEKFEEKHSDLSDYKFEVEELASGMARIKWKNQAFGDWVESQPRDTRELLINGGKTPAEVREISKKLTEFKSHVASSEQEQPEKKQIKPDLSRSILPSGRTQTNRVKMTEDEIIAAAAAEEMKKNM